ncbi:MFS transporter [Blastococcus sp. TML/M2B]|uniref:MFS transporter n=1 Tax=unclassified Blastococcus TaxID=2619396 RepID=UPI00190DA111|nr:MULTISPECIES: MFS transporter [unclassified Blastococcus]MBN1092879.1 MFS transporter [Blastococcus sp. TML/M2B]MBN1097013.1 MFS transporter [Blastococcus sp. TML/C7B]
MSSTLSTVLRQIGPSVMLPMLVYEIGHGAVMPVIALVALDAGASTTVAGLMLAAIGIGTILGDVPAAWLANRVGEKGAMLAAMLASAVAMASCLVTGSVAALAVALLVLGACGATMHLARQSYVADVVAVHHRARAMSTLGGVFRIGLFIGPFVGAGVISIWGTRSAFAVAVVASLVAAAILALAPVTPGSAARPAGAGHGPVGVREMFRRHRRLFLTLGIAVASIGAIRAARVAVIPLWADHIGLDAATTSLVFGIANFVDMALFYPSGHVMDRLGRLWIAVPCMVVLGLGTLALPLTDGVVGLTAVAMVMAFGNGIGSGIVMTLGADTSPELDRRSFLAIFRLINDVGTSLGPVVPAAIATVAPLGVGIAVMGGVGLLGAAGLARWVPRYSTYATRAMVREHHRRRLEERAEIPQP